MERYGLITVDRRLKDELFRTIRELDPNIILDDLLSLPPPPEPVADADPPPPPTACSIIFFDAALDPPYRMPKPISGFKTDFDALSHSNESTAWIALGPSSLSQFPHHPHLNGAIDLIITPLDKTVALQKLEYLRAKDQAVTPSFLFQAKVEHDLEIGKISKLTNLSETSCTILSPLPLLPGVAGTLISQSFGQGPLSRIEVRSIESEPAFLESPLGIEKRYEVNLRFLGLRHEQLMSIRKCLGTDQRAKKMPSERNRVEKSKLQKNTPDKNTPDKNTPAKNMREKEKALHDFRVALLSPAPSLRSLLETSLDEVANPIITAVSGLKQFEWALRKAKVTNSNADRAELACEAGLPWHRNFIGPKRPEDSAPALHAESVTVAYLPKEQTILAITPELPPGRTLLRATADQWDRDASPLTKPLTADDRDILSETIRYLEELDGPQPTPEHSFRFDMSSSCKETIHLKIKRKDEATPTRGAVYEVTLTAEATEHVDHQESATNSSTMGFEAVLVDAELLRYDAVAKLKFLDDSLNNHQILNAFGNKPPVVIVNASEQSFDPQILRGTSVTAVAFDFVDRRYHRALFLALSRPELWSSAPDDPTAFAADIKAVLVRPSHFAVISEVSLTVIDRAPFKVGTELMLFSTAFPSAQSGIWGRVRATAQHDEGQFANEFIFFGVTDQTQKEIRRLINEDYAKKKAKADS